jgi:hypothetical protein
MTYYPYRPLSPRRVHTSHPFAPKPPIDGSYLPSERSERYYGHLEVPQIVRREVLLEPGRANEVLREDLSASQSSEKGLCKEPICVLWCKQRSPKGTLSNQMAKLCARRPTLTIF